MANKQSGGSDRKTPSNANQEREGMQRSDRQQSAQRGQQSPQQKSGQGKKER